MSAWGGAFVVVHVQFEMYVWYSAATVMTRVQRERPLTKSHGSGSTPIPPPVFTRTHDA